MDAISRFSPARASDAQGFTTMSFSRGTYMPMVLIMQPMRRDANRPWAMPPRPSMKIRLLVMEMFCSAQYFFQPFSSVVLFSIN